jgi:hypothetical protein
MLLSTGSTYSVGSKSTSLRRSIPNTREHEGLKTNLDTYNKILKKSIRQAKAIHHHRTFEQCEDDPKKTWKNINSLMNRKTREDSKLPQTITIDGINYEQNQTIVQKFNHHFSTVGQKVSNSVPETPNISFRDFLTNSINTSFVFERITVHTVLKAIDSLSPKQSTDKDGISSNLLKTIKSEICAPLKIIINQCLSCGLFPDSLKIAKVLPLFKKGETSDPGNYLSR